MIAQDAITRTARSQQTTELNVAREYCQHVFLSIFYRQAGSERVMFKGGTALKIAYSSPRFSEDLDFSGFGVKVPQIEGWLLAATGEMEQAGIPVNLRESKATSGGYLASVDCRLYDYSIRILMEVSMRSQRKGPRHTDAVQGQGMLITPDLLPAYTLTLLPPAMLVEEKIAALLVRGKPRDFYDLYFMLRKGMITPEQKPNLVEIRQRLKRSTMNFQRELGQFLPRSHQAILKNFQAALLDELQRHGI